MVFVRSEVLSNQPFMEVRLQISLFFALLLSVVPTQARVLNDSLPDERPMERVLETALSYLGTPYRYGGLAETGIDCSGLVLKSFQSVSFDAPRSSAAQSTVGQKLSITELKPGDLVFFRRGRRTGVRHVGLVVSIDAETCMFVHASCSEGVTISDLNNPYWKRLFVTARRWTLSGAMLQDDALIEEQVSDYQEDVYISPLPLLSATVMYRPLPGRIVTPALCTFPVAY